MKITWSVPVFSEGLGSGRGDLVRALSLIEALRIDGHRVCVVEARNRVGAGVEESLYRSAVTRLLPERGRLVLRDAAWWWRSRDHGARVARAAREQGAEVLVETQVHGVVSGPVATRATGLPLVLDDVSPPGEVRRLGAGLPWLSRRVFRRQREAASLLVAPSGRIRKLMVDGASPPPDVAVIPNGVDLASHRRADREGERRRLGLDDELVVGFVGSFQPWHQASVLVRAFADLEASPPPRLLLVGDGPGRKPALTLARTVGVRERIQAPGRVSPGRVPAVLAACDVGVLPGTNAYGHPMKILEYAAAGLPIVAPDVPPVREMVGDGSSAVLFEPGDAAALGRALTRLAEEPALRRRLGEAARARIARGSTWRDQGKRLARALGRVAAEDGRSRTARPPGRSAS